VKKGGSKYRLMCDKVVGVVARAVWVRGGSCGKGSGDRSPYLPPNGAKPVRL